MNSEDTKMKFEIILFEEIILDLKKRENFVQSHVLREWSKDRSCTKVKLIKVQIMVQMSSVKTKHKKRFTAYFNDILALLLYPELVFHRLPFH